MANINVTTLVPLAIFSSVLALGLFPLQDANANHDDRRSSSIGYQLNNGHNSTGDAFRYPSRHYPYSGLGSHYPTRHNSGISLGWSIGSYNYSPVPWGYRLGQTWGQDPWGYGDSGYSRWPYGFAVAPRYWRNRYYLSQSRQYPDNQYLPYSNDYGYRVGENAGNNLSYGSEDNTHHSFNEQVPTIVNQVTSQESTRKNHSSGLQSLPENAKVIQLEHGTVYEWQGTRYTFDWSTQTYQKLVTDVQAKQE